MEDLLAEDWVEPLRKQLKQNLSDLGKKLSEQEKWLDENEESIDEAAHEETVRRLEKLESVLVCLEEALEALDD